MWSVVRRRIKRDSEGQGLLEFALVLPVLLIMFLGLIELALLLRAYLVVVNVNREAARLASRGTFTNDQVITWAMYSFAEQLPAQLDDTEEAEGNTRIVITHFHVPAGLTDTVTYDGPYVAGTLSITRTSGVASRIDPEVYSGTLKDVNDEFNEDLLGSDLGAIATTQDVVYVETFYIHRELLRAPLIDWVFPNEMEVYSWTVRRVGSGRGY